MRAAVGMKLFAFALIANLTAVSFAGADTIRLGASTPAVTRGHPYTTYIGGGVRSSVYDGLTQISQKGELQPALAVTWEMVTPTRWLFRLRDGVRFSNGVLFNADTVVANIRFLTSDQAQRFGAAQELSNLASARKIDSATVEFETQQPDLIFPRRLSTIMMVEPRAWEAYGEDRFANEPVGTGPFRVVSWGPGASQIVLDSFAGSWRKSEAVTRVEITVIPDATTRFQALVSGRIDLATNMDPDTIGPAEQAGLKILVHSRPIVLAIAFRTLNNPGSPLQDVRVRQALNYAVNKGRIVENLLRRTTQIASQEATATVTGYNPSIVPFAHDPQKAVSLLRDAGFSQGMRLVFAVFSGQVSGDALIFQQVSQDLRDVGVDVELRILPFSEFTRRIASGDWDGIDGFSTVWSSITLFDALPNLEKLTCRKPGWVFCAPDLAPSIDAARGAIDESQRIAILQNLAAKVHDLAPSLLLVENADIVQMRNDIENYTIRSDGMLFNRMSLARSRDR